jgi:signal transduction histidine kinase
MQDGPVSDEETRLLAAFRRVQGRFEEAIAREREFIANVRHEIRTPLAALRTDIELLGLALPPDSPQQERAQRALAAIDAITGSLESARALSHRQRFDSQPVELARLVDDAWSSLGSYPQSQGLRFVNAVAPATMVNADRHALLTILRNLIRNAADHAAPALCTVRLTERGVEVADDGPGIAANDLPFVFDRYYRARLADAPDQTEVGDRGLGLAIARQVADLNGWTLSAQSDAGRGTSFVLRLGDQF